MYYTALMHFSHPQQYKAIETKVF